MKMPSEETLILSTVISCSLSIAAIIISIYKICMK